MEESQNTGNESKTPHLSQFVYDAAQLVELIFFILVSVGSGQ